LSATKLAGCTPIEVQEHAEEEIQIELEEAARVLYVAATRARDLLVVCTVGDHPYDGWLGTLNPVLYPAEANSFNPETKQPSGCLAFGNDTVLGRPPNALRGFGSVSPGLHRPRVGEHRVVWWDPATLAAPTSQARSSSRLMDYLKEDDGKVRSEEGIRAHERWQVERANARTIAGRPEWNVLTATAYATALGVRDEREELETDQAGTPQLSEVTVETIGIDFSRPHGKRFGTLVHAVLSVVALDSDREGIEEIARVQGRVLGAPPEDVDAAVETVRRALQHPLLQRAAAAVSSGNCRREIPVIMQLEDGTVIEGVVDLAFRDNGSDGSWIVVDYKTDFEIAGRLEEYRKQVGLYALAISRATGKDARGTLLRM
jgi:ATP-dependent exoDNAse (exonuclease V) beta subunit